VAYTCKGAQAASTAWRKDLYNEIVAATGLKGNRSNPMPEANFDVIKKTTMPAVLLELGFMDSKTDVPVILTDAYADKVAAAIVKVLVARGKLTKKAAAPAADPNKIYRVQCGAFKEKANADKLVAQLKAKGFDAIIV
jgi:N-acetylmuramoyl-L-alanine amidase